MKQMPVIIIKSLELLDWQKAEVTEKCTAVLSEVTKVPKEYIYTFFEGRDLNELAVGGVMLTENPPKDCVAKFNTPEGK
jgi:phenylpyruvate tautomerase PptA (4-oxalocrotonate tautomerase family)